MKTILTLSLLLITACALRQIDAVASKHEKLIQYDCYEKIKTSEGYYVDILPTDFCLELAYGK